ncbi:RrF2 family transcriptional regulator [Alphaproteobacteria bacterium]|nr:RrF2 family transcriptional regulator [Alphaproteobacteria bacterium]
MKLGTKARYAVTALVDLALHGKGEPMSLSEIALRQGISVQYLEQIFVKLRRQGLVESVRGQHGGYLLSQPPECLNIAQIVQAVDESVQVTQCRPMDRKGCQGKTSRCLTHDLWAGLGRHIHGYLEQVSLRDVLCQGKEA